MTIGSLVNNLFGQRNDVGAGHGAGAVVQQEGGPQGGAPAQRGDVAGPIANIRQSVVKLGPSFNRLMASMFTTIREQFPNLNQGSWSDRQETMRNFSKESTNIDLLTAKEKNCFFVAGAMNDKELIQNSASFFVKVADRFRDSGSMRGQAEVRHGWPSIDKNGGVTGNQKDRGWSYMGLIRGVDVVKGFLNIGTTSLSEGMSPEITAKMQELSEKEDELTLDETAFIIRGMAVMRDVMKVCKSESNEQVGSMKHFIDSKGLCNIVSDPVGGRSYTGRARLTEHPILQRDPSDRNLADANANPTRMEWLQGKVRDAVANRFHPSHEKHDYVQGSSGTTLDFLNFCMWIAHPQDEAGPVTIATKEEAMQSMEVMYLYWHFSAPDGYAHSQYESVHTMVNALFGQGDNNLAEEDNENRESLRGMEGLGLTSPVSAHFKSFSDVKSAFNTRHVDHNYLAPELNEDGSVQQRAWHTPGGHQRTNG